MKVHHPPPEIALWVSQRRTVTMQPRYQGRPVSGHKLPCSHLQPGQCVLSTCVCPRARVLRHHDSLIRAFFCFDLALVCAASKSFTSEFVQSFDRRFRRRSMADDFRPCSNWLAGWLTRDQTPSSQPWQKVIPTMAEGHPNQISTVGDVRCK